MKKLFFTAVLACFVMTAFGQKKVLRNANKAFKKESYEEAATLATEASNHPDTKDNPDVYVLLGKIELAKFADSDKTDFEAATGAYEYFKVAMEKGGEKLTAQMMEPPVMAQLPGQEELTQTGGSETMALLERWLIESGNDAYNSGNDQEAAGNEEEAQKLFRRAYQYIGLAGKINFSADLAIFAGYVASLAGDNEGMLEQYGAMIDAELDSLPDNASFAYYGVAKYHYDEKNWDSALEVVAKSKEALGFDKDIANLELQVYLDSDRMDEAIKNLEARIEAEPNEATNYVTLANVYWFVENNEKAAEVAAKALTMDPNNFQANYILGGAIYGTGAELNRKAGDPSLSDDEYNKTKAAAKVKFEKAKPYFEKCLELQPDNSDLYPPLATIYEQLGMNDKRDEMIEKMGN